MVRRLILALTVVAVMAGALIAGPAVMVGNSTVAGTETAVAQPGAPDYCGPYQTSWYVSSGSWWYVWV